MKKVYLFILSLYPILLLRAGVFHLTFLTKFPSDQILITNLLGISFSFPYWVTVLFGLFNMLLLWLIVKKLFNERVAFLSYLIYGISPWSVYLEFFASIYVILTTFLLLFFYGLITAKKRAFMGSLMALAGFTGLLYGSLLSWFFLPFLAWGLHKKGYLNVIRNKYWLVITLFIILTVFGLSLRNHQGLLTTAKNQLNIFSDVGLINTVNVFQGENRDVKPQIAARLTENRYSYLGLHFMYNALNSLNPINYFTPQQKIFNFSLSPAIWVGLLIPFFLGLAKFIKYLQKNPVGLTMFSLLIPSFVSRASPDFNRMFIFSPVIFLLTALGLTELLSSKNKTYKKLVYITIVLVAFQLLTVFIDIFVREPWRLNELIKI